VEVGKSIKSVVGNNMEEKELLKLIKSKYAAIQNNLLETIKVEEIKTVTETLLDQKLIGDDLLSLQYKKFKSGSQKRPTLWSDRKGLYPSNGLEYLNNWFEFLKQYLENKRIKNRLENEGLWVQSHIENNEEHLFIGEKNDKNQHIHIIRGRTGELRIDEKDLNPQNLVSKVESTLEVTLSNGQKIRSVKGILEFIKESDVE
jgi:hypothetical protein